MSIPTGTIIKVLARQIQRLEKQKKGHSFAYAEGEIDYLIKTFKQVRNDYNDYLQVGKPIGQSVLSFRKEIEQHSKNHTSDF